FVGARDCDLRAVTRFARDAANLDGAVVDLAHFQLEEAPDKIWMAARDDDLRSADSIFHRHDIGAEPIADVVVFDHNAFPLRHDRFEFSEIENHIRTIEAAHGAAHDFARAVLELLVNHFLLDLPDAL